MSSSSHESGIAMATGPAGAAIDWSRLELPLNKQSRRSLSGEERSTFHIHLKVVTPILGGSPKLRCIDEVDVIRAPTIRGHLRFWWRALNAHAYQTPADLFQAESHLWGSATDGLGGRSRVEIGVSDQHDGAGAVDDSQLNFSDANFYSLWPARTPHANRRSPNTTFKLMCTIDADKVPEIENSIRAWILFGGYGSRTRRGLGSLTVTNDVNRWLPQDATIGAIGTLFKPASDRAHFETGKPSKDVPMIQGASLYSARVAKKEAVKASEDALGWLKEFRQGPPSGCQGTARQPALEESDRRPSISNWPEPDMARLIGDETYSHEPRAWVGRAWPRAGFGLPIQFQFQRQARESGSFFEPDNFTLKWSDEQSTRERLASPLIVKAMPLANGNFVSIAFWLNRAYPVGQVSMLRKSKDKDRNKDRYVEVVGAAASFDCQFVSPPAIPNFIKKAGTDGIRSAFFNWLESAKGDGVMGVMP